MIKTNSLHKINSEIEFGFSADEYSMFKYGDINIAKKYGEKLAISFIKENTYNLLDSNQIVVLSSPYCFIPTATFSLTKYFVYELNKWLVSKSKNVVQESKIHRTITYKEDYGGLSAEQRIKLIGNDSFHIDKGFMENKLLLFIDDVKITGSHELVIKNMLNRFEIKNNLYFIYFAELINKNIHPKIENVLNNSFIKSISDINKIIDSGNFKFNTRVIKYMLCYEEKAFNKFIVTKSKSFCFELYNLAIGNSYHTIKEYAGNLSHLSDLIKRNKKII